MTPPTATVVGDPSPTPPAVRSRKTRHQTPPRRAKTPPSTYTTYPPHPDQDQTRRRYPNPDRSENPPRGHDLLRPHPTSPLANTRHPDTDTPSPRLLPARPDPLLV